MPRVQPRSQVQGRGVVPILESLEIMAWANFSAVLSFHLSEKSSTRRAAHDRTGQVRLPNAGGASRCDLYPLAHRVCVYSPRRSSTAQLARRGAVAMSAVAAAIHGVPARGWNPGSSHRGHRVVSSSRAPIAVAEESVVTSARTIEPASALLDALGAGERVESPVLASFSSNDCSPRDRCDAVNPCWRSR